jgi:hypothetical protein
MKVWITKWCLTAGIKEHKAELCTGWVPDGSMINVPTMTFGYFHKPDWYDNEADAVAHADTVRIKRISALKKKIVKLEKMKF